MSDEKAEALREATREANGTLKDMHRAMKDAHALLDRMAEVKADLLIVSHNVFDERMDEQVRLGLEHYSKTLDAALEGSTQAMYDRMDTLARVLLGKATPEDETLIEVMISKIDGGKPIITQ